MVNLPIEYSDKPVTPFGGMALMILITAVASSFNRERSLQVSVVYDDLSP